MNTIKQKDYNEKKAKVFISFVLDESGSMGTGKDAVVSGINEQIQTLKTRYSGDLLEPVVTFVKFADNVMPLYEGKTIEDLKEFEPKSYAPNGSTALYDAVGYTIDKMNSLDGINDEGNSCLMVVITDGEENASKKFNSKHIAEKIQTLNKSGKWTITYLGPNDVDLSKVNKSTNISYGNMARADFSTSVGYSTAFKSLNRSMNTYISGTQLAASSGCFFASDSFYDTNTIGTTDKSINVGLPTITGKTK
jgi:uncharacterized protein YegL